MGPNCAGFAVFKKQKQGLFINSQNNLNKK